MWHERADLPYDFLVAPPLTDGVTLAALDESLYSHLIIVCGPYSTMERYQVDLLQRMQRCRKIGINLSMIEHLSRSLNGFDVLIERDSDQTTRPDLSLLYAVERVPVVGRILVGAQSEYGTRGLHDLAHEKVTHLLTQSNLALVEIDTKIPNNAGGLNTLQAIESVISKMDAIVTTRLHGLVLALKQGVPVVAVDPIEGGAKITSQAYELRWPVVFNAKDDVDALFDGLAFCLTAEARRLAEECAAYGRLKSSDVESKLLRALVSV